jgi:hypothetical protein
VEILKAELGEQRVARCADEERATAAERRAAAAEESAAKAERRLAMAEQRTLATERLAAASAKSREGLQGAAFRVTLWRATRSHAALCLRMRRQSEATTRRKRAAPGGKSVQWWQKARMAEEPEAAGEAAFLWSLFPEE